jgi:hypothetical protein
MSSAIDRAVGEHIRHLAFDDEAREALGDRGLADPRLADVEGIVLAPPAQDLDRALDFELAADERIDAALLRQAIQVRRIFIERAAGALRIALAVRLRLLLVGALVGDLR